MTAAPRSFVLPRTAGKWMGLAGRNRSLHCIITRFACVVANVAPAPAQVLAAAADSTTAAGGFSSRANYSPITRRSYSSVLPRSSSSEALNALEEFKARLEEPAFHRKPSSRADEAVHKSTLQGLASSVVTEYAKLPPLKNKNQNQQRAAVLTFLAKECGASERQVAHAVQQFQQQQQQQQHRIDSMMKDSDRHRRGTAHDSVAILRHSCTPKYDRLFQLILEDDAQRGMQFLVSLRSDLLALLMEQVSAAPRSSSDASGHGKDDDILVHHLKELDGQLKNLLSTWFGTGMLEIRRITYEGTSAQVIETIAKSEAVHPVRSLEDLRTRLGDDHRVFAAFHPLMLLPNEVPLVFCHVALRPTVSTTMRDVLETHHVGGDDAKAVKTAVFYSISSTQAGLSGIDLGQILLKEAMTLLRQEFSTLETFVTLSPIPRFRKWLQEKIALNQGGAFVDDTLLTDDDTILVMSCFGCSRMDVLETLRNELEDPSKMMETYADELEPLLMKLATRYLLYEKHHGKPLDGVARFHVRNGAEMYQLNYRADESRKGLHNSLGIMINYRYQLSEIAKNQLQYELDFNIPVSAGFSKWLPADYVS